MKIIHASILSISLLFAGTILRADEIKDAINESSELYDAGNLSGALNSLNYASQLMRQKIGEKIGEFLPEAPAGWTRDEVETQSGEFGFLGGGNSASANYTKGDSSVKVSVATNSPLLQSIMMMASNPMFLGSKKLERISGQQAIIDYNAADKGGSIQFSVAAMALVSVEGSQASLEDMKALAGKIPFQKLQAFLTQ